MVKKKYIIKLKEQSRVFVLFSYDILGDNLKVQFNNNDYVIYLKKDIIKSVNFNVKDELEIYFKSLFRKLKKIYNIEIKGFYNIKVYIDKYYGVVLEIQKEDYSYYDYLDNQVDMKITTINTSFLYQVDDIILNDKVSVFKIKDNIFLSIKEQLDYNEMNILLEFGKLIYNTENIEVNLEKVVL